jgi:DnaJ family protein B protein 4
MPRQPQRGPKKAAAVEVTLPCTLEELYSGKTKNMRITRNVTQPDGRTQQEQEARGRHLRCRCCCRPRLR